MRNDLPAASHDPGIPSDRALASVTDRTGRIPHRDAAFAEASGAGTGGAGRPTP